MAVVVVPSMSKYSLQTNICPIIVLQDGLSVHFRCNVGTRDELMWRETANDFHRLLLFHSFIYMGLCARCVFDKMGPGQVCGWMRVSPTNMERKLSDKTMCLAFGDAAEHAIIQDKQYDVLVFAV